MNRELGSLTYGELYRKSINRLRKAGIEDYVVDSLYLMKHYFNMDRNALIMNGDKSAGKVQCDRFFSALSDREKGKPLQYILGIWNFMGNNFYVGEGVLIPRDDTEILVQTALAFLKGRENQRIIDLCSGSGAVAISIAKELSSSEVIAVELSDDALRYMKKNIDLNKASGVEIVKGDVFKTAENYADGSFDLVVCNPPYIKSDEIATLQKEIQYEPRMALDGGKDGLDFYRVITDKWSQKIRAGGMLAYEIGEEQYLPVKKLMEENNFENIAFSLDFQGFKRVISGMKKG